MADEEKKETEVEEETEAGKTTTTKIKVEEEKEEKSRFKPKTDLEFYLMVALALVVGILIGYFILKFLKEREADEREREGSFPPYIYYPYIPPPPPMEPPTRHHHHHVASPPVRRRRSAIDPEAFARTPESLRRHGIYLDERGEACMTEPTIHEIWQIIRDGEGKIVDAVKHDEGEEEVE